MELISMNNFQVFHQHIYSVGQSVNIILIFFIFPPFLCEIGAGFTASVSTNNKTLFSLSVRKYFIFENKVCSKKFLVHFCTHHIHFCSPEFHRNSILVMKVPLMLRV